MIIVADISGNHGGHLAKAKELIEVAAKCGCDYAKFQYYRPGDMYATTQEDMEIYRAYHVPHGWLAVLFDHAANYSIGLFASVFSVDGVKELLPYKPQYFKLASPQSTWLPGKIYRGIIDAIPEKTEIILSAAESDRIKMQTLCSRGHLLYCPEGHPPPITNYDFRIFYEGHYDGLSDHTDGLATPLAFARISSCRMIEKHLKLDNNCIDAHFSATPATMERLCQLLK